MAAIKVDFLGVCMEWEGESVHEEEGIILYLHIHNMQIRVFTIPILVHGIITIWRVESPKNQKPNSRFYSKIESFGTEN